ncbi:MAG: ABC-2 family transporter protein [Alphaproteobacteria bacterium]|nr:ABC-2 family transporter protein [Alphaproteobacteria bacterium]
MAARSSLRFFWVLLKTNISNVTALKLNFVLESLFMAANNMMMFATWVILFHTFKEINGWNVRHLILMTGIVMCSYSIYAAFFRGVADTMAGYIERGEMDTFILQPRNILLNVSGSRSAPSAMGEVLSGAIFLIWSGMITIQTIPLLLLCILAGFLVFLAVGIFIGSLAFYMKEVEGWGMQIMNIFLSLSTQPGSIYTGSVKLFLIFVFPAGVLTFMPVEAITNPTPSGILTMIGIAIAFFFASILFFYRGLKHYESGNSFGIRG